jgi:quinoprotein dehydrogenase-associated probable ABC transporter substrate-binding protein
LTPIRQEFRAKRDDSGCHRGGRSFRIARSAAVLVVVLATASVAADRRELRVCADPNNLPFSNDRGEGFENKIAELIAREIGAAVRYTWWAQRRGFVRNTLREGLCDMVVGVPAGYDPVLTTKPYYRSTYVFVWPQDQLTPADWFDDPRLRSLRIGVHLMGDDGANAPPAHALSRRGIIGNVVGYTIYGDYREADPPARLIDAVAEGAIDVAIAWGPLAGYFAPRARKPLRIVPVAQPLDPPALRFVFAISMGVRKGDAALRDELQSVLERRHDDIQGILKGYGVPLIAAPNP